MKNLLCLFAILLTFGLEAKIFVISDIDDTIKQTNTMTTYRRIYHFLRNKPFEHMPKIFKEMEAFYKSSGEDIEFIYVSAAPDFIFNQQKFLRKNGFPMGKTFLKKLDSPETYTYKYLTIKNIINAEVNEGDKVFFFGDNSEHDPHVYVDIKNNLNVENAEIFIRDVSTEGTDLGAGLKLKQLPGVQYFFSEMELAEAPTMGFITRDTLKDISLDYTDKTLLPDYTFTTLKERLEKIMLCRTRSCKRNAKARALKIWENYHSKYTF